jgi:hypothetical protein
MGSDDATRWRYVGGVERVYPHVPVTVQDGAVIEHVGRPAEDGCWEAAGETEVTHQPDNAPPADVDTGDGIDDTDDHHAEQQQFSIGDEHKNAGE